MEITDEDLERMREGARQLIANTAGYYGETEEQAAERLRHQLVD